jgi:hypothetical protein
LITSGQIRAARAMLRWSADELSRESKIGLATIRRMELCEGVPNCHVSSLTQIKLTLEAFGIEFIGLADKSPGVRLHSKVSHKELYDTP